MHILAAIPLALLLALPACTEKGGEDTSSAADTSDPGAVDGDGDGFTAAEDCDDADASVNPGATETCDGVDNDCDGEVDEADAGSTWYLDLDGDGAGDPASGVMSCAQPAGMISDGTDCNDADAAVYPGAAETCGDGLDTDCDGVDDACRADGLVSAATALATLMGEEGEFAGSKLSAAGDVDGDGHGDIWVGLDGWGPSGPDSSGGVMLVAGPVSGASALADVARATLCGEAAEDHAGGSLSGGADLDGDGGPDVLIGAYNHVNEGTSYDGAVYAVYGAVSGAVSLATADATVTVGDAPVYDLGAAVSTSPDITGDGVGDAIIGSYGRYDDNLRGEAWIFPGPMVGALTLDGALTITGTGDLDLAGNTLAGLGDVNGDGQPDLAVGAHGDDAYGNASGAAALFYGPLTGDLAMLDADRTVHGEAPGDELSRNSLAGSGDVNGDGIEDWVVGSPYQSGYATYAGAAYLILGDASARGGFSAVSATARLYDTAAGAFFARSLSIPGDLDGDGFADVAVGALAEDTSAVDAGAVFVWYGPVSGALTTADAQATYLGEAASDSLGVAVSGAGDMDGDETADLLTGAWSNDDNGENAGAAYLFP